MPVNTTIKIRKGTESEWNSSNPVLASGEPGFVIDKNRFKIGDGSTSWNSLSYAAVVPSGFLAGSGVNITLGSQGVSATIGVTGLNSGYLSDFNSAVSGLIPVKNIVSGVGIDVSSSNGIFTITSTGSGVLSEQSSSLVTTVFNKTASTIPKMKAVYIDGGQGDIPTIQLAIATGDPTSAGTYGLTRESIASMSTGKVTVFGSLTGLDTDQFNPTAPVGNVNGTVLYLSPTVSGGLTTTKPHAPDHIVTIGTIVRTHQNEGVIEVRVQNGFELEELHDVAVTGVTNGQFLQYNSGSGLWVPSSSGNFTTLQLNGTTVSVVGHTHVSSDITNFNSSVSGLLPTISNSGDNKLLTSTGSTVGINAENNLTYDGSTLTVTSGNITGGNGDGNYRIKAIRTGTYASSISIGAFTSQPSIEWSRNAGGGALRFEDTSTGSNVERMRIDHNGYVGINTTSPTSSLTVSGIIQLTDTAGNRVQFFRGGGTQYDYSIAKEGNHLAVSTANDGSTFRYTQFGYHSGSTWTPKTVINNYNGKIGILNTTPSYELDVTGSGRFNGFLDIDNLRLDANTISSTNSNGNITISPTGTGKVGVRTSSPTHTLHINGSGYVSSGLRVDGLLGIGKDAIFSLDVQGCARFGGGGTGDVTIGDDCLGGEVGVVVTRNALDHCIGYIYSADESYRYGGLYGGEYLIISSGGLIGVGTSSPVYNLDVVGTGNFSQNLLVNGTGVSLNGHTHVVTDITDFSTGVANEVDTTLVATTGIDLNYDSGTNSLVIGVTGLINNPADNRVLTSRDSTSVNIDAESDLTFDGSTLRAPYFVSTNASGDEGGEIKLTKPPNGTLSAGITIDAYINKLRFFEDGGSSRGYYLNMDEGVAGASRAIVNKTLCYFTPLDNQPPASAFATLDTRNSIAVLDFDDTTQEAAVFVGVIPENAALGSGISVRIHWMATSATTGSCRWGVQFEKMNTDLDSDSFDTATEAHSTTNGTSGIITTTAITCTSIDSLAAGDLFRIKIYRDVTDTTNDTMTGDAEIVAVELRSVL